MTLTKEQSSNKAEYEALSTDDVIKRVRTAMTAGCIRPAHVYDLVDEALDRLAKIEALVKSIDLICGSVNAVSEIKKILTPNQRG